MAKGLPRVKRLERLHRVDKPKMGRPPIAPSGRLGRVLQIRLSDIERDTYQRAADRAGIALSAWMRDRLTKAAMREAKRTTAEKRTAILAQPVPRPLAGRSRRGAAQ